MKRFVPLFIGLLAAGPVLAQDASDSLDLRVPEQPNPHAADAVPQGDPPGVYHGDTSGKPAPRGVADSVDDDGKAKVWGSFTTGIGHSKGYGTTRFNALDLNVSKSFGDGERNNTLNLNINVEQGDGPGFGGRHPYFERYREYPPPR